MAGIEDLIEVYRGENLIDILKNKIVNPLDKWNVLSKAKEGRFVTTALNYAKDYAKKFPNVIKSAKIKPQAIKIGEKLFNKAHFLQQDYGAVVGTDWYKKNYGTLQIASRPTVEKLKVNVLETLLSNAKSLTPLAIKGLQLLASLPAQAVLMTLSPTKMGNGELRPEDLEKLNIDETNYKLEQLIKDKEDTEKKDTEKEDTEKEEMAQGGVASMFRKKLEDGDLSPEIISQIESYAATGLDAPTISSLVGVSETQVNNVLMSGSTSEVMPVEGDEEIVETAEVTEEADPLLNLFQQNDSLNNDQAITTLFAKEEPQGIMAAKGGRIRFQGGGRDGGYTGPNMADIAGPVTSSFTDDDDNRQTYGATTQYSNFAEYEDEKFGYDDTNPLQNLRPQQIKTLEILDKYDSKINPKFKDKWNDIKSAYTLGNKVMNATTGVLGAISAISAVVGAISKEKAFNEQLEKDIQTLKDMDIADFNPTVDTPIQTLEQLQVDKLNSRINKNDKDEPDGIQPYIAPITLEVDTEFAQGQGLGVNMRSALDKIRANQARRNGSVATGNIQDNQIMMANRGGLAGLFRVKNQ